MLLPYKPVLLPKAIKRYKYIIIHDLTCMFTGIDQAKHDSKKSQIGSLRGYNWILNGQMELNYHFIVEKIGRDYETVMGRPFHKLCVFNDIPSPYDMSSLHIAMAGHYKIMKPSKRFYMQMGYRAIAPLVKWFSISVNNIYLHSEVSTNKDIACPGPFFNKNVFLSSLKPMMAI